MDQTFLDRLARQCEEHKGSGLFKPERVLGSPQQPVVRLADGRELVNLCANNYLALANHPAVRDAARAHPNVRIFNLAVPAHTTRDSWLKYAALGDARGDLGAELEPLAAERQRLEERGAEHLVETRWFEMGLHDRPDNLRSTLQEALEAVDVRTDIEAIVLAYGLCGRGTTGLRPLRHCRPMNRQV